jgi:polyferredoxin
MFKNLSLRTVILFIFLIAFVAGFSIIFNSIWSGKSEQVPERHELIIEGDMTIGQFGNANNLPNSFLQEIFDLKVKSDLGKRLNEYGTPDDIASVVGKKLALASEHASKNWIKILLKFILWIIFLSTVFIFLKKRKITSTVRKWLLFSAILIFGIIMGADPSPMGTVKDAIHLFAADHVIFPQRMIALTVFLVIVFLANKYICAWGCQLGTLQDIIFRINRSNKHRTVIGKQIKMPFVITNTIRVTSFFVFTAIAFAWGIDIIEPIDPFKIFKPLYLGTVGGIFVGSLMITSLFVYRPWCHLFCPFGLVGWFIEKISLFKIRVNYKTCIACQKCASACPSTVMDAILKQNKKTIPDCFACDTCVEVCPTDSISFSTGYRNLPPQGHFDKKKKAQTISG